MRPAAPARPDIHARITQQIISQLEAGVRPWTRPWSHSASVSRPLRHDGTPYNGINVVLLWGEAADRGYTRSTWMTFRQALALGAHVRKGERGATVVYANQIVRDETDDTGADVQQRIPFLKAYTVSTSTRSKACRIITTSPRRSRSIRTSGSPASTPSSSTAAPRFATAEAAPITRRVRTMCRCRRSNASRRRTPTTALSVTR